MDNFNSNMFNSNVKILDLKNVKTDISISSEFLEDLAISLLKEKTDPTISCGITLLNEDLLSYKNKNNTLFTLVTIIRNLKGIRASDIDTLIDIFTIGIDIAEQSFISIMEFSRYTTNITVIAEPSAQSNQRTLHSNNRFIKNFRISAIHSIYDNESRGNITSFTKDSKDINSEASFLSSEYLIKYFDYITNLNNNKVIEKIEIKLSDNKNLKEKQVEVLLNKMNTFFTDDQPEDYSKFNIEYKTLRSVMKPYCFLS